MAIVGGYYRYPDTIQNSGTALRKRNEFENVEIYNSSGKIYPRQVTEDFSFSQNDVGGFLCQTVRSGYNLSTEKGSWRTDKAYQGYYAGSEGTSRQAIGHIFPANEHKFSVGGDNLIGFTVTSVEIKINREKGGYWSSVATGHLRQSNLVSSYKNGQYRGMRFEDVKLNDADLEFTWQPYGQITTISGTEGSAVCNFVQKFLSDSSVNSFALYNGENSPSPYSRNYASCSSFSISITGRKTVQL